MKHIDWNAEAVRVANYIARHVLDMRCGALLWHNGVTVAFGTDGYVEDERSQAIVDLLRQIVEIPAWKIEHLGFGVNDGTEAGRTWVLLLDPALSDDVVALVHSLDEAVWTAWHLAHGQTQTSGFDQDKRLRQEAVLRKLKPPRGLPL